MWSSKEIIIGANTSPFQFSDGSIFALGKVFVSANTGKDAFHSAKQAWDEASSLFDAVYDASLDPNSAAGKQVQQKANEQINETKKAKEPAETPVLQSVDSAGFRVRRRIEK